MVILALTRGCAGFTTVLGNNASQSVASYKPNDLYVQQHKALTLLALAGRCCDVATRSPVRDENSRHATSPLRKQKQAVSWGSHDALMSEAERRRSRCLSTLQRLARSAKGTCRMST
jgi:hypothetical protein